MYSHFDGKKNKVDKKEVEEKEFEEISYTPK